MNRSTSGIRLVAAAGAALGAVVVAMPPATAQVSAGPSASVVTRTEPHFADASLVLDLAQRCIDPQHVALISNALRHGRVFTVAEAQAWCAR